MTIKNKEKIKELITRCNIFRFSTEETLNYLKENGHEISDRTLRRMKNEIDSKRSERFINIAKNDWTDEMLRTIDTLKELEKESWRLLSQNPTITEKIRIINTIGEIQANLLVLMNSSPTMDKMFEIIDSRLVRYEKMTKHASLV